MSNARLSENTDKGYFLQAIPRIDEGEYQRSRRFRFGCLTSLGLFDSEGTKTVSPEVLRIGIKR